MRESDTLNMVGTQVSRSPRVVRVPMTSFSTSMPEGTCTSCYLPDVKKEPQVVSSPFSMTYNSSVMRTEKMRLSLESRVDQGGTFRPTEAHGILCRGLSSLPHAYTFSAHPWLW